MFHRESAEPNVLTRGLEASLDASNGNFFPPALYIDFHSHTANIEHRRKTMESFLVAWEIGGCYHSTVSVVDISHVIV